MRIAEHNILTLDYWRDEVSYQGITLPSGSIGCAVLNISDDVIEKLKQISHPLQAVIEAVGKKKLKPELLTPCGLHFTNYGAAAERKSVPSVGLSVLHYLIIF